ncbi:hypothetical protein GCM10011352_29960 [Marinobacterium zhoushanense]|uniref:Uncharacterized protein n=1 Tax=Marinobacterium zhoushanense TaxID=1679163 RepID=A0ABQ1KNE1_9GAMM|nr:hypothetical protein [Marinobacterium zhoushanense]GGC01794.1 hypothetical protein GCM10011352_29960 [Marinobacterium zhoushanense]
MSNLIRHYCRKVGMTLLLVLMLLSQSLTLQASSLMSASEFMTDLHTGVHCGQLAECDQVLDVSLSDCCDDELEHPCGAGQCSLASACPPMQLSLDVAPLSVRPDSRINMPMSAALSRPYTPPKIR